MPRLVSLIVLVVILLLIGALFIQVMAQFLLPIFLAIILAVIFHPLHLWLVKECQGRAWAASGLTVLSILLIVLLPLTLVGFFAVQEAREQVRELDQQGMQARIADVTAGLRERANDFGIELPSNAEIGRTITAYVQAFLAPVALEGAQLALGIVIGIAIMTISLYYFFLDGPGMIETAMKLSPLDDRYERQLIQQFGMISRAVVLSTLLSAAVQGVLAGIGYWLTGLPMVMLLMALTGLLALVPFVGAAAVWIPCCFWLAFGEERYGAALFLLVYGAGVISMADNVVKPLILSGRANLHPLLALLSVLGGVQALGPIGILVGPMAVSFLQALLIMLRTELESFSKPKSQMERIGEGAKG